MPHDLVVLGLHGELLVQTFRLVSGVNVMLRMIAVKAASKPLVEITQDGEKLSIKTSTTVRTTHITFTVGQEFNESTVDGRPCTVNTAVIPEHAPGLHTKQETLQQQTAVVFGFVSQTFALRRCKSFICFALLFYIPSSPLLLSLLLSMPSLSSASQLITTQPSPPCTMFSIN